MSHMAIGIGAAARADANDYTSKTYDALPTNKPGQTDAGGTTGTSRKRAASPQTFDKMLQDERGFRVQLMKDTTLATDYGTLDLVLTKDGSNDFTQSSGTKLTFLTGSTTNSISSLNQLRVGLRINKIDTNSAFSGGNADITASNIKISKIESGVSPGSSGGSTITFDGAIPSGARPGAGAAGPVYIQLEYVDRINLTTYSTNTAMPNHPTLTHEKSVFEPKNSAANKMGPFGAALERIAGSSADTFSMNLGASEERSTSGTLDKQGPFTELGLGMLGVTRGRIGAFYERYMEYNVKLIHTTSAGLTDANSANQNPVTTNLHEPSYAVLDGTANTNTDQDNRTARFPFLGAEEDKPAGQASVGVETNLSAASLNNPTTSSGGSGRGTEFIQFGTAVDGIFQGELLGSSITADSSSTVPEGYAPTENDYGTIGGLTVDAGEGAEKLAVYDISSGKAFISYDFSGASYAPNAVAGSKKNGDRVVYVATFKENNPRPELDYQQVHATATGTLIPPTNRIYPITEAGIFNKHKKDLGIFDVANRTYTGSDAAISDIAHIDTRVGLSKPTSGTSIVLAAGTVADDTNHPEIEGVLTSGGVNITASSHGFTQGPISQTMLCRTTFDPVNKATADTLQITWSVQLQDAT